MQPTGRTETNSKQGKKHHLDMTEAPLLKRRKDKG
jgi:hypothetical protein